MRAYHRLTRGFLSMVSLNALGALQGRCRVSQRAAHPELPTGHQACQSLGPDQTKSSHGHQQGGKRFTAVVC